MLRQCLQLIPQLGGGDVYKRQRILWVIIRVESFSSVTIRSVSSMTLAAVLGSNAAVC